MTSRRVLQFERPVEGGAGTITVRAEELASCREVLTLSVCARKVDKKDWFSKSDPFLAISRVNEDNTYTMVRQWRQ